jgi:hypothetical protein
MLASIPFARTGRPLEDNGRIRPDLRSTVPGSRIGTLAPPATRSEPPLTMRNDPANPSRSGNGGSFDQVGSAPSPDHE